MKNGLALVVVLAVGGCASVSTIPLSADSFQLTSRGMSGCSPEAAQKVAFEQAAVETIRRGYDSFVITGTDKQSELTSASLWGGSATYGHNYSQGLTVRMFKAGDPAGAAAIPARDTLGPKWEETIKQDGPVSCV
jgi:hypothetical protein